MSVILFYDTETSGLVNKHKKLSDDCQPHCLQIGAGLYDTGEEKFFQKVSILINCQDANIDKKALETHGITKEMMQKGGVNPDTAMHMFCDMANRADECIGFNVSFDRDVIASGMFKVGFDRTYVKKFYETPHFDIMKPLTDVCKIPGKYGYKWPKLTEAYELLIDAKGFDGAHDAFADIMATFELWEYCLDNDIELEDCSVK